MDSEIFAGKESMGKIKPNTPHDIFVKQAMAQRDVYLDFFENLH